MLRYLSKFASADGFNEYFRKEFDGNERSFMRWKTSFDVLEIRTGGVGPNLPLEQQVRIRRSEREKSRTREDMQGRISNSSSSRRC